MLCLLGRTGAGVVTTLTSGYCCFWMSCHVLWLLSLISYVGAQGGWTWLLLFLSPIPGTDLFVDTLVSSHSSPLHQAWMSLRETCNLGYLKGLHNHSVPHLQQWHKSLERVQGVESSPCWKVRKGLFETCKVEFSHPLGRGWLEPAEDTPCSLRAAWSFSLIDSS